MSLRAPLCQRLVSAAAGAAFEGAAVNAGTARGVAGLAALAGDTGLLGAAFTESLGARLAQRSTPQLPPMQMRYSGTQRPMPVAEQLSRPPQLWANPSRQRVLRLRKASLPAQRLRQPASCRQRPSLSQPMKRRRVRKPRTRPEAARARHPLPAPAAEDQKICHRRPRRSRSARTRCCLHGRIRIGERKRCSGASR